MANEVVLREVSRKSRSKPIQSEIYHWSAYPGEIFMNVYHDPRSPGSYTFIDLAEGRVWTHSAKAMEKFTPLGPCRIEVTPC